jgi:hypothetical protein
MRRCALCGRPLEETTTWKGRGDNYYCSEFCAETETIESPPLSPDVGDLTGRGTSGVVETLPRTPGSMEQRDAINGNDGRHAGFGCQQRPGTKPLGAEPAGTASGAKHSAVGAEFAGRPGTAVASARHRGQGAGPAGAGRASSADAKGPPARRFAPRAT